jgi:hypothetical protein
MMVKGLEEIKWVGDLGVIEMIALSKRLDWEWRR